MHSTLGVQCGSYETSEYASPFTDIDFWEYCLSIPLRYRYKHYIYKKWILKCYPEAGKFNWETIGGKITDSEMLLSLRSFNKQWIRKVRGISKENQGMNPFDYYYNSDLKVKRLLDDMLKSLLKTALIELELKKMLKRVYDMSDCRSKIGLISALQSIKEYF